ncbi:MAG: efflux RND transporter permease subunit [Pseudomonadota bacterium]
MNALIDAAMSRRRVVLMVLFVIVTFGLSAALTIPRESDPDVNAPFVFVSVVLPGISPEDADRLLIKPTDIELRSIEGVKEINGVGYEGAAQIVIEFESSFDPDQAVLDVREAVDRAKAEYPTDAEEPVVDEFNPQNFPIISVILSGDAPERAIYQAARRLQDAVEQVPGVLEANLSGAREELLEVVIDPGVLETYNLSQEEILRTITNNNRLIAAGAIDTGDGRFAIKVPGLIETAQDVFSLPIKQSGDAVVTFADVAEVRRSFVDASSFARFNGKPSIGVDVVKRSGANILETSARVRALADAMAAELPESITIEYAYQQSVWVQDMLGTLTSSVLTAVLLVMIVVVAALGVRSALMVGIAIPSSFLFGFLLLQMNGMTLNTMVMFGMVLAVGMLVDGAIVIVEYADRRMSEGRTRYDAYGDAAKRMFWPITSSTGTTLAAFIPFLFWDDVVGEYMKYLPLTLIFVLSAALLMALIFLPTVGSIIGPRPKRAVVDEELDTQDPRTLPGYTGQYARVIERLLERPLLVVGGSIGLVFGVISWFNIDPPDVEYFIRGEPNLVNVYVSARGNYSAIEKLELVREVEQSLVGLPGVKSLYTSTGGGVGRDFDVPSDAIGLVAIEFLPYRERGSAKNILAEIRERASQVPGIKTEARADEGGPPVGKDIELELSAKSQAELMDAAAIVRRFLETDKALDEDGAPFRKGDGSPALTFVDVEDSSPLPGIDWRMEVDREQAGRFGADITSVGGTMQLVTNGILAGNYRPDDSEDEIDIRFRFTAPSRDLSELDELRVMTNFGAVPISNFVKRVAQPRVDRVNRRDGRRIVEVKANANADAGVPQNVAIDKMKAFLESGALGPSVEATLRGASEDTDEAQAFFLGAMISSLFLMGVILVTQFNSFYHTFLTLLAVLLSVVGVLLGIKLSGSYISIIMTGTGVVALAGIVVNNNIVLLDTYQQVRVSGLGLFESVMRTGAQRLRPVMLTTVTTICGLLPMVFSLNVDYVRRTIGIGSETSEMWRLISSAIVFGLSFSTILTLIITPVLIAAPTVIWGRVRGPLFTGFRWARARLYNRIGKRLAPQPAQDAAPAE